MWNTDSLWLEVAIVTSLTAVGTIFFGHFEEQTPKWRKVLKLIFFVFITTSISATAGRIWAMSFLGDDTAFCCLYPCHLASPKGY